MGWFQDCFWAELGGGSADLKSFQIAFFKWILLYLSHVVPGDGSHGSSLWITDGALTQTNDLMLDISPLHFFFSKVFFNDFSILYSGY